MSYDRTKKQTNRQSEITTLYIYIDTQLEKNNQISCSFKSVRLLSLKSFREEQKIYNFLYVILIWNILILLYCAKNNN